MERTEAIEVIRKSWPVNRNGLLSDAIKTLIPEFRESEDERIRKEIYNFLIDMECKKEWIAYLEKQKEQKPAEWKPLPESMEALLLAIEGKWDAIKPTGYMSRRLEDLYDGLVNTYNVDESLIAELPRTAYTAENIEELRALKAKIEASMGEPITKPTGWSKKDKTNGWTGVDLERYISCLQRLGTGNPQQPETINSKWFKEHCHPQPLREWSEEDEEKITFLERLIRYNVPEGQYGWVDGHKGGFVTKLEAISILKSLRPSWKPSEEQMEILGRFNDPVLKSLYSDLQKLL